MALVLDPILSAVVLSYSVVHSIFGVGLLLFATPTLILLGYGFAETIAIVLPCSIAIDLLQLRNGLARTAGYLRALVTITLPAVMLGSLAALYGLRSSTIPIAVGGMLLLLGFIRCSSWAASKLKSAVDRYRRSYMAAMGLIHGVSNMGGGLLVVLAGTCTTDKEEVRRLIATAYTLFALTQLSVLMIVAPKSFHPERLYLVIVAVATYAIANRIFKRLSVGQFQHLLTALIIFYGGLTLAKYL